MFIFIIDFYIYFWNEVEVFSYNWYVLDLFFVICYFIVEYCEVISLFVFQFFGFIYIEVDCKNDDFKDWLKLLNELVWMCWIIEGKFQEGEGYIVDNVKLCLGIIFWVFIVFGLFKLKEYIVIVEE